METNPWMEEKCKSVCPHCGKDPFPNGIDLGSCQQCKKGVGLAPDPPPICKLQYDYNKNKIFVVQRGIHFELFSTFKKAKTFAENYIKKAEPEWKKTKESNNHITWTLGDNIDNFCLFQTSLDEKEE